MTDLHITGPNGDGEYWLHIKAGGKMGGINLGVAHGPLVRRLLDAAAIEAPVQEPAAWRRKHPSGEFWEYSGVHLTDVDQPLYTTPPDHLALVAAAYRDAADIADDDDGTRKQWGEDRNQKVADITAKEIMDAILSRTPADAEAHLTALLRAEYERGVRAMADIAIGALAVPQIGTVSEIVRDVQRALLTQEGR